MAGQFPGLRESESDLLRVIFTASVILAFVRFSR
jgi:hypothetical protein